MSDENTLVRIAFQAPTTHVKDVLARMKRLKNPSDAVRNFINMLESAVGSDLNTVVTGSSRAGEGVILGTRPGVAGSLEEMVANLDNVPLPKELQVLGSQIEAAFAFHDLGHQVLDELGVGVEWHERLDEGRPDTDGLDPNPETAKQVLSADIENTHSVVTEALQQEGLSTEQKVRALQLLTKAIPEFVDRMHEAEAIERGSDGPPAERRSVEDLLTDFDPINQQPD